MTLQDCLLIIIGENDTEFQSVTEWIAKDWKPGDVGFVHAPIGSNTLVTTNGRNDVLTNSTREGVVVVRITELDKMNIEAGIDKFNREHLASRKPLLEKIGDPLGFKWVRQYNYSAAIVVANRRDLFGVLKQQLSGKHTTSLSEGAQQ